MPETAIAAAIAQMHGQVALQQALWEQEGMSLSQQAISLWKQQGYAPEYRHKPLARILSDGDEIQYQKWCDAFMRDIAIAELNKSVGA